MKYKDQLDIVHATLYPSALGKKSFVFINLFTKNMKTSLLFLIRHVSESDNDNVTSYTFTAS